MATQGSQANAKDDTLYYARGSGYSDMADDLSQYNDDQVVGASWTYEPSPASRFNVTSTWCAEASVDLDNTDTGRFFAYANLSLSLTAGGAVEPILNGAVQTGITLPGISGSDQRFVIAWATEPNLRTTGAGDALRTELRAWNDSTGAYVQAVYTHALRTSGTADFVWWASNNAATETREDFIGATATPTLVTQSRIEFPIPDHNSGLADAGELVGPIFAMGAASVRSMGLRLLSPIVNISYDERTTYEGPSLTNLPTQYALAAPDPLYTLLGNFVFYRPVPTFASLLRVRVNVQQWRTAGATDDRVHVRMYSMRRPPNPVGPVVDSGSSFAMFQASSSIATSHGSGAAAGGWVDLGRLRPARNSEGHTWLALAIRIEDLSGTPANNRLRINAINVDPVVP